MEREGEREGKGERDEKKENKSTKGNERGKKYEGEGNEENGQWGQYKRTEKLWD